MTAAERKEILDACDRIDHWIKPEYSARLTSFVRATLAAQPWTSEPPKVEGPTIGNLVMLIARLVQQIRRFDAGNPVAEKAMDYLRRKNIGPSVLREINDRIGGEWSGPIPKPG